MMKKTLIVLCGTALLFVGLFCFGFVTTTTAQPAGESGISPWQSTRAMKAKMLAAKERDCADAIKRLPGIANAEVVIHTRLEWDRNAWEQKKVTSVEVFVDATDNRPLVIGVINAIGLIVAPTFGIADMEEIRIVDTKHVREYNGAGVEQERGGVSPPVIDMAIPSPGTTATPASSLSVDQDYIELLKKRVEVAQAELALLEAEVAFRQHEASR